MPASSLTVKTEPAREAAHAALPTDGAVTVHALPPATAMPAPDSVMAMPALAPAAMAAFGVNEMVAVVDEALTPDARVIARLDIAPVIAGNVPLVVASMITGEEAYKSSHVPAATFVNAACALVGVRNDCKTMEIRLKALYIANTPYSLNFTTTPAPVGMSDFSWPQYCWFVEEPAD